MSRLERFILRLKAQRNCLDAAAAWLAGLDGPMLELGLGNGRTYDHLRERFPDREIFVFERRPQRTRTACRTRAPDPRRPRGHAAGGRELGLPAPAVLVHSDIGTHDLERDGGSRRGSRGCCR